MFIVDSCISKIFGYSFSALRNKKKGREKMFQLKRVETWLNCVFLRQTSWRIFSSSFSSSNICTNLVFNTSSRLAGKTRSLFDFSITSRLKKKRGKRKSNFTFVRWRNIVSEHGIVEISFLVQDCVWKEQTKTIYFSNKSLSIIFELLLFLYGNKTTENNLDFL